MRSARSVCLLVCLAGVAKAQPYVQWGGSNNLEGNVVYMNNSNQMVMQSFSAVGGYTIMNYPAANGGPLAVFPTMRQVGGNMEIAGQQSGFKNPFDTSLNEQIGNFQMEVRAQANVSGSGGSTVYVVRNQNPQDAASRGINTTATFSLACFSSAKKRTDGIGMGTGTIHLNNPGSAFVTVGGIKYFSNAITSMRLIAGLKQTVTGSGGQQYTVTIATPPITRDIYNYALECTSNPSQLNWSVIDVRFNYSP